MQKFTSLTKPVLLICFLLTIVTKGYSQISDVDAKLAFQKISDAYEASAYYNAATQAEQLKNKMGNWNPKVLYIYLQSVYKAYNGGKEADNKFGNRHETFVAFKALSDSFFPMIDKDTYPKDKLADMVTAQQYFADMAGKSEYQTTRTPEKAVAFLNQCAMRFRNFTLGNARDFGTHDLNWDAPMDNTPYINFRIDSSYLRIVMVSKTKNKDRGAWNRVCVWNDIIDLKHAPAIDEGKTTVDDRVYIFNHHYYTFDRQGDFDKVDTIALSINWIDGKQFAMYKSKFSKTALDRTPLITMVFPIDLFFNQNNKEFIDGKYADRIREAYNYLLTYYAKEKMPVMAVKKKEEVKSLGF